MTTKVPTSKAKAPKPPIVSSAARGHLNARDSATDSKTTIKEWCLQEGKSRGYDIPAVHWEHILQALSLVRKAGIYPKSADLSRAMEELLRPFDYDEQAWVQHGLFLLHGDDPRKTGVTLTITPYVSPEKGVYFMGENKTDHLT